MANTTNTVEQKRALLEAAIASSPFTTWIGTRLTAFEEGKVEIEIDVRPDLTQHHGFAHGAVVGYLADTACAWAAASVVGDVVTAGYTLNLLSPAVGETLRCRADVVKASRSQVVARADVFAVQGGREKIVATALATIARVERQ